MLLPKTKRNIGRVIPFGILWFIFSLIYCILEKGILGHLDAYPATDVPYNFGRSLIAIPVVGIFMGLLTGILEIGYFSRWFIKKSFTRKIVYKSLIYLLLVLLFLVIITLINVVYLQRGHASNLLSSPALAFLTNYAMLGIMLYMAAIIVITQFYSEFSDSLGPGTLRNFFLGIYHHPVQEERIFMFLDMKSSTTIAEKLGHMKYFAMLKEYFFDLSNAVIDYGGTIYQYAGDEMIITWKLKDGLKNNNCIECFFAMKRVLEKETEKYTNTYGCVPAFKAGLHYGMVTTGEIGSLKKEIIFTGDVLNTSARIQGLCNQYNTDILLSEDLAQIITFASNYVLTAVGDNLLKGRSTPTALFSISRKA